MFNSALKTLDTKQYWFDVMCSKYNLTQAYFHKKHILRGSCPYCTCADTLLVFNNNTNKYVRLDHAHCYCTACHSTGIFKYLIKKQLQPMSYMEYFINSSQIRFNNSFVEYPYQYSMFGPVKSPEDFPGDTLMKLRMHWTDGISQLEGSRCIQGFSRGDDICFMRGKRLIANAVGCAHKVIKKDTPCIIFPFGPMPGKWYGFYAYTPEGVVKYYSTKRLRQTKDPEYIFLRLNNTGRTKIYNEWAPALDASWETIGAQINILLKV